MWLFTQSSTASRAAESICCDLFCSVASHHTLAFRPFVFIFIASSILLCQVVETDNMTNFLSNLANNDLISGGKGGVLKFLPPKVSRFLNLACEFHTFDPSKHSLFTAYFKDVRTSCVKNMFYFLNFRQFVFNWGSSYSR